MTKLAIVDLDGVVANPEARFAKAEEAKRAFLNSCTETPPMLINAHLATDVYWREAFNPIHIPLDTLIEGADECIAALELAGMLVIFLTSRPAAMRKATVAWLEQYKLLVREDTARLVLKESAFQYTKTVVWKAGMVQTLAAMLDAQEVLFVSDEQKEIDELQRYDHPFALRCALSLDSAVNGTEEEEADDERPF